MSEYNSKTITPLPADSEVFRLLGALPSERAARERDWKCVYPGCRMPGDFIVKHLLDGAVESEYLVCVLHEPGERVDPLLD